MNILLPQLSNKNDRVSKSQSVKIQWNQHNDGIYAKIVYKNSVINCFKRTLLLHKAGELIKLDNRNERIIL